MAVEFSRIDDRLLHGQVVTTWIRALQIEQCIIISEAIAQDSLQRQLLELAAPEGLRVVFFKPDQFVQVVRDNPIRRRTMLLFNHPRDVLHIIEQGYALKTLNIGGMKNDGAKKQISKAVAVDDADTAVLHAIVQFGVKVTIQMVPADIAVSFERAAGIK